MSASFSHSKLKLARADQHISEIEKLIEGYSNSGPQFSIEKTIGNYVHFEIYRTFGPPMFLPMVIGDAIHNLRTSLDAMACAAVRHNDQSDKDVYFPFAESEDRLEAAIKKKNMDRSAKEVVDLVRQIRPYRGGNIALRAVHDLDIQDKHKGIILQISQIQTQGIGVGTDDEKIGKLGSYISLMREGVVAREGKFAIPVKFNFHHLSDLADGEVVQTLRSIAKDFRGILNEFELCCFGKISY